MRLVRHNVWPLMRETIWPGPTSIKPPMPVILITGDNRHQHNVLGVIDLIECIMAVISAIFWREKLRSGRLMGGSSVRELSDGWRNRKEDGRIGEVGRPESGDGDGDGMVREEKREIHSFEIS